MKEVIFILKLVKEKFHKIFTSLCYSELWKKKYFIKKLIDINSNSHF